MSGELRVQKVEPRRNLGWANDWYDKEPEALKACRALGHQMTSHAGSWRCVTVYECEQCNIKYAVDSSD